MKRILFVSTSNIFVPSGGGLANKALLKVIEDYLPGMVDVVHPQVNCEVPMNFIQVPDWSLKDKVLGILSGRVHKYNPWLLRFLDSRPGVYSHCFINCGIFGDLIIPIKQRGIKVASIHHNYEVEFQMDNHSMPTLGGLFPYFVKRNERLSYFHSDLNCFLTQSDLNTFTSVYGENSRSSNYVVGIFEDHEPSCQALDNIDCSKIVVCGSLNSYQTIHGINDFVTNYLPIVQSFYEDKFQLLFAGRNPQKDLYRLMDNNSCVKIIANPKDMSETISGYGIFLCPTNIGGGIKLRIMDGLKMGMPVITHRISARGYDCFYRKKWFQIYDDDSSFKNALEAVNYVIKSSPMLREEIVESYKQYFSYSAGKNRLQRILTDFFTD